MNSPLPNGRLELFEEEAGLVRSILISGARSITPTYIIFFFFSKSAKAEPMGKPDGIYRRATIISIARGTGWGTIIFRGEQNCAGTIISKARGTGWGQSFFKGVLWMGRQSFFKGEVRNRMGGEKRPIVTRLWKWVAKNIYNSNESYSSKYNL